MNGRKNARNFSNKHFSFSKNDILLPAMLSVSPFVPTVMAIYRTRFESFNWVASLLLLLKLMHKDGMSGYDLLDFRINPFWKPSV